MAEFSNEELIKLREVLKRLEVEHKERPKLSYDEELKESGFGAFTKEGQIILERIRNRYEGDFRTFFVNLNTKYLSYKRATPEVRRVSDVLSKITSLTAHVDKLIGSVDFKNAPQNIKILRSMISDLDSEFRFFTDTENITNTLAENISETEKSTGISLSDLRYAQGIFGKKIQEINKPSPTYNDTKGLGGLGKDLRTALLASTLTPLAPLIGAWMKYRSTAQERARRSETIGGAEIASAGVNVAPSIPFPRQESLGSEFDRENARRGLPVNRTRETLSQTAGIQESLFIFFNARAYQARWTKELLEGVSGISGKSVDKTTVIKSGGLFGPGSLLGNLAAGVGSALGPVFNALGKTLASAAAVSLAAVGGWLLGRWLGENLKWGGKTLDQHAQGFFLHTLFGGDDKDRLKKQAKEEKDPVMRRSYELQLANPGMTTGEASKLAADEWKNRPAPVGMGMEFRIGDEASKDIMKSDMSRDWAAKKEATLDQTTGMYVVESKTGGQKFMGITPEEAINKRSEFEATISKASLSKIPEVTSAASQVGGAQPKVPIDTTATAAQRDQLNGINKLNIAVDALTENIKDTSKSKTGKSPSGYDANNTRNPLLSSLDAGKVSPA